MKHTTIIPSAAVALHNGEAARTGDAADALNVRRRENSLETIGTPVTVTTINEGDRILVIDGDRYLTENDGDIKWNGTVMLTSTSTIISAQVVGEFVVVATEGGNIYLHHTDSGYERLQLADAVPQIHLAAINATTASTDVDAYTFNSATSQWQYPLATDDVSNLTTLVGNAWKRLLSSISEAGQFSRPLLARYGVRLWDDTYLWLSAPILIGADTIATNYRATSEATQDGGQFTGIAATTLSASCYQLGITVLSGVGTAWHSLVKSIDIFTTDEIDVANTTALDYRIAVSTSTGTRRYVAELGPAPRSKSAIVTGLMNSSWHLVASTTHLTDLNSGTFSAINVAKNATSVFTGNDTYCLNESNLYASTLSLADCAVITNRMAQEPLPLSAMAHSGRLYTGGARLRLTHPWSMLPLFAGTITKTACTAKTIVTLATSVGTSIVAKSETLAYTPSALSPMVTIADIRATHVRYEITSGSTTVVLEQDLTPFHDSGTTASFLSALSNFTLTSGTGSSAVTTNNVLNASGKIMVSVTDNPFVTDRTYTVTGATISALAIATKPLYSGGFGRYPIYVFTSQGIFALPQNTSGTYGEARLLSRKLLADGLTPIEGGTNMWFKTPLGQLCAVSGSNVVVHQNGCKAVELAWNDVENELWLRASDDSTTILMDDDHYTRLTLATTSLYSDGIHALAVTSDGKVLDLHQETATMQTIYYLSHPFTLDGTVKRIAWNIFGENLDLHMRLRGERGSSCHGFLINSAHATGTLGAPIIFPVVTQPARTLRIEITGSAPSGTLILPTEILTKK